MGEVDGFLAFDPSASGLFLLNSGGFWPLAFFVGLNCLQVGSCIIILVMVCDVPDIVCGKECQWCLGLAG